MTIRTGTITNSNKKDAGRINPVGVFLKEKGFDMKTLKRILAVTVILVIAMVIWYLVFTGQVMNAEEAYEEAKDLIQ